MTELTEQGNEVRRRFAVYAEKQGYDKPLVLVDLSFGEVVDTIVKPHETGEPFRIDGVPVTPADLLKLKIVEQDANFMTEYRRVKRDLITPGNRDQKARDTAAKHYDVIISDLVRGSGIDVTNQVLGVFEEKVKPSLTDYLPRREELLEVAFTAYRAWMKSIGAATPDE